MSKKISISVFIFALLAALLVSFLGAFVVVSRVYDAELRNAYISLDSANSQPAGKFEGLEFLDMLFAAYSYAGVDDEAIAEAVFKAYADATGDRYAEYYTEEEFKELAASNAGDLQGVGVNIIENDEYGCIEVIGVMPNSPALEAGIMAGDLIVYIGVGDDRESVSQLGYENAIKKLQGTAGTVAEFVVHRGVDYQEEIEFSIERKKVKTQSVTYRVCETDADVGIVKIVEFNLTTPTQFCEAVDALLAQGIEKFVFDVRYNPGGDLQSIIAVLSYFLNEGDTVISTMDNMQNKAVVVVGVRSYTGDYAGCSVSKDDIGKYRELDCVVLANELTGSAAELFTANFRDYQLAKIVGVTTYGKGSMQNIFSLADFGYTGGVKMTTKMYFPPCGESYEGIGITPDIEVELSEEAASVSIYKLADADDNQLQRAIQELK